MRTVTLLPGDGIGPEIVHCMQKCIEATGVSLNWDRQDAGGRVIKSKKTPLPSEVLDSIRKHKVAIKGPITTPVGKGFRSVNVALRQELELFANVRPIHSFPIKTSFPNTNMIVVRENSEDLYSGIEFEKGKSDTKRLLSFIKKTRRSLPQDSALSIKPISRSASKRIMKFACDLAIKEKRKKVTAIHKANIMKATDGLFLESGRAVAKKYPTILFNDLLVDNACMQLVRKPDQFDVLVLPNLYGDIISELCAGLVGGIGLVTSGNYGKNTAVFEPAHGSAPQYAGKNKVNPTAMILTGALLLRHIGKEKQARKIETAIHTVLRKNRALTYDLGGKAKTSQMCDAIIKEIH